VSKQEELSLSFEEGFRELEQTVQQLETGDLTLEQAIALFERGMRLAQFCMTQLDQAEMRVRQLVPSAAGEYEERPLGEVWPEEPASSPF
jgi:exodeoxyribonuclease VII small subunit